MNILKLLVILNFIGTLGACATSKPPISEYNLARTAVEAAQEAKAQLHAPAYWSRAERALHRAEEQYKLGKYKEAQALFKEAKLFAERAENSAAIKRLKEGAHR